MIVQAVHSILRQAPAIVDQVGDHVHLAERPQKYPLPAIVIERASRERITTLRRRALNTRRGFLAITVLADSYIVADDIAGVVADTLDGFHGDVVVVGPNDEERAVHVKYLIHDGEDDLPSDHRDGQGRIATHGIQIDFRFGFYLL